MEKTVRIRNLKPGDRDSIRQLLEGILQFTDEERDCAVELMDISFIQREGKNDYEFLVAETENNKIYGFVSFGDIPLAEGCYDLYWIVCDPLLQNKGIGTKLLIRMEEILKERGARKLFAETSSQEVYLSARTFYEKRGFKLAARIQDFYKQGDDKFIYVKTLIPADQNADNR